MTETPGTPTLKDQIDHSRWAAMGGMDIPWLLDQRARQTPDKPFVWWEPFEGETQTLTYGQLQIDARRLAAGLYERGVRFGDFVIIHMNNSLEFIVSWFACAELGAVAVSTNTRSVARDLSYFADHTDAVCALTQPEFAAMIVESCPNLRFVATTETNSGERPDNRGPGEPFEDLFSNNIDALPERTVDPEANLSVQFTSGTTSRPKAVLWTHANGVWAAKISASHMRLRDDDRTLIYMPLFHTNAQGYSMLASMWAGATVAVQPRFSASRFWDVALKHQLTWVSMIPFAWKAVADQPVPDHSYRFWGTMAHLPAIEEQFKVQTIGWWGMTETLTQGIITDHDLPGPAGTIGRVAPEYEIQIRNRDGSLTAHGERGLLYIRGTRGVSMFKEYYRNDEANEKAFDADGWFDTGDLVRTDVDGNIFFSDRDKDMLKVGAENVAASEIESVIMLTGWVNECAVVAQRHPMLEEVPVAFVLVSDAGGDEERQALADRLTAHCAENLADFKVPRSVFVVDELPRSTIEKIAKNELRASLPVFGE